MSLSTYQLAKHYAPVIATGAIVTNWLFQGLFVVTTWHVYRSLRRDVSPKTRAAHITSIAALLLSVGVMEGQPWTHLILGIEPTWETMRVVKDCFLVLYALSTVITTNYLQPGASVVPRFIWVLAAPVAVGGTVWMYYSNLMRIPTVMVMIYCSAAFIAVSVAYWRLAELPSSTVFHLRLRTISHGYLLVALFAFLRAWQTPALPDYTRLGLAILNRLIILGSTFMLYLGFAMPRWFERAGVGILDVLHAREYLHRVRRYHGLVHDLTRDVSNPQRVGLAALACETAQVLGLDCSVVWDVAHVLPIRFVHYSGCSTEDYEPPRKPYSKGLDRDMRHFAFVYDTLTALMVPILPANAPQEAKVVRAACMYLDGEPQEHIAAETSPDIAKAVRQAAERSACPDASV